jgi:hypothetical protein
MSSGAATGAAVTGGAGGDPAVEKTFIQRFTPTKSSWGLILWVAGIIFISVSMTIQLFTLSHGTSGQLSIDKGLLGGGLWPVLTGAILLAVGFTMWNLLSEHKGYSYPALFMLAFSSYIMANFAIFASTRQVIVATK